MVRISRHFVDRPRVQQLGQFVTHVWGTRSRGNTETSPPVKKASFLHSYPFISAFRFLWFKSPALIPVCLSCWGRSNLPNFTCTPPFSLPCFQYLFLSAMVVVWECDERVREIRPADPLERAKLQRDCLRHATRRNGFIDWEAYDSSYFGHISFLDLSSGSGSDDSDDSDCVFLYATSGKEVVAHVNPQMTRGKGVTISEVESDTEIFGNDVQSYASVYYLGGGVWRSNSLYLISNGCSALP